MDGAVGLTQRPINPSKRFTYKFHIDEKQSGSFWYCFVSNPFQLLILTQFRYHSHSELQRADGLYGGIVIHKPTESDVSENGLYHYDQDIGLLIGDWYHRSSQEVQAYYEDYANAGNEVRTSDVLN